jgi:hypothetical protein
MQRDVLEVGGFGEALGNDVSRLVAAVAPCRAVLEAVRRRRVTIPPTPFASIARPNRCCPV